MIETVTTPAYRATDGTTFTDRYDAIGYQATLDAGPRVGAHLNAMDDDASDRERKARETCILDWIDWSARMDAARAETDSEASPAPLSTDKTGPRT